jgi:hypothetical protein
MGGSSNWRPGCRRYSIAALRIVVGIAEHQVAGIAEQAAEESRLVIVVYGHTAPAWRLPADGTFAVLVSRFGVIVDRAAPASLRPDALAAATLLFLERADGLRGTAS